MYRRKTQKKRMMRTEDDVRAANMNYVFYKLLTLRKASSVEFGKRVKKKKYHRKTRKMKSPLSRNSNQSPTLTHHNT